jgi:hypothetical protein
MQKAENIPYKQTGTFAYSAAGSAIVYNTGSAVSGEPVFTKLTCKLNLAFTYTMQGGQLVDTSGSQKLYALILDEESGWQRTIPLTAETAFVGNTTTNKTTLDLCQVAALVASMEQATGIHLNSYTLVIVAHVTMGGRISGQKFTTIFDPRLTFGFDGLHLYLLGNSSLTNPMQTVQSDTITNSSLVDNTFLLFGLKPSVGKIRMVALIGLGSSLAGLVALWIYSYSISRRSEESIIHLKYSFLLMGVHEKGLESLSPVIDVTGIEDLVKLAQRQNVMIMHLKHGDVHYYLVQVEGKTYRYMTGQGHNAEPGREQE